jgi:hypothetical protein
MNNPDDEINGVSIQRSNPKEILMPLAPAVERPPRPAKPVADVKE